jgi:hypothetical protein
VVRPGKTIGGGGYGARYEWVNAPRVNADGTIPRWMARETAPAVAQARAVVPTVSVMMPSIYRHVRRPVGRTQPSRLDPRFAAMQQNLRTMHAGALQSRL